MSNPVSNTGVPNFLCIGAQKSGVDWLHNNLRQHPQVWMPPVRSLRYFQSQEQTPILLHLGRNSLSGSCARAARHVLPTHPLWAVRYLLGYRTDGWYQSLFKPVQGQICGEATADYCLLPSEKIAQIKSLLPNVKIIYLLREPVERMELQIKTWLERPYSPQVDQMNDQELHEVIVSNFADLSQHCDFSGILQRWEAHFDPDRMWVGFYEQIAAEPANFLKELWRYLEVVVDEQLMPTTITTLSNPHGIKRDLPTVTERWMTEQLYPQIESAHHRFDNFYTKRWLQKAKMVLQKEG